MLEAALRDLTALAPRVVGISCYGWIGGIYPAHNEDRVLMKFDEVPRDLVERAARDRRPAVYSHIGVRDLARHRARNNATLSGKGVQGGSTLTQQLVKIFISPRTHA